MFARIALAVPFGTAIAAGLLFLMHLMVTSGSGHTAATAARVVDFVRVERAETVQTKDQRPERPEAPERAPEMPEPSAGQGFSDTLRVALAGPEIDLGSTRIDSVGFDISDGEYLPIVKVAPRYPTRALQRRLEGHVLVEFVVTASGAVRDVVVIESTSEIFEAAAIEAALKFKYKPRVVDGQPIEVSGIQNRITFKLDA